MLFAAPYNLILGRVPLFCLFLDCNASYATPMIPYHLCNLKRTWQRRSAFEHGISNAADPRAGGAAMCMRSTLMRSTGGLPSQNEPSNMCASHGIYSKLQGYPLFAKVIQDL